MKENIAIIGFMGSGKTTIGRLLAEKLGYRFIDLDKIIELSEERTVKDIFKNSGEENFRKIESAVIYKIIKNKHCVFACGGGVILKEDNMRYITRNCIVVYLMISASEAYNRLSDSTARPLIPDKDKRDVIRDLMEKRGKLYLKFADIVIDNNRNSPENTVNTIIGKIRTSNP